MARTEVSICNQALSRIGAETISSLDEGNAAARNCNVFYDDTRDEILDAHPWSFALARKKPTPVDSSDYPEWDHAFAVPTDAIRVVEIVRTLDTQFRIEGDRLLCSEPKPILRYVRRVEDPTKFSPLFTQALVARLAAKLAGPVKNAPQLEQGLLEEYFQTLMTARQQDAEGSIAQPRAEWWTDRGSDTTDIMDRIDNG